MGGGGGVSGSSASQQLCGQGFLTPHWPRPHTLTPLLAQDHPSTDQRPGFPLAPWSRSAPARG